MNDLISQLTARCGFRTIQAGDRALFAGYGQDSNFFDLCFSNFWCWERQFRYVYKVLKTSLAVVYWSLEGHEACILLPRAGADFEDDIHEVYRLFSELGSPTRFGYVPEQWLPGYRRSGLEFQVMSDRDLSDYIYDVAQFTALSGSGNKCKRRELSAFEAQGQASFVPLTRENFDVTLQIFEKWCGEHRCEDCVFGCEREAYARLADLWDGQFYGGIVSLDGEPVAFAVAETLGGCACYIFQKNARRLNGLTYYLHYHCAQLPGHPDQMNWCEDMGLEGLRLNKLKYKPCAIETKYWLDVIGEATGKGSELI